MTDSKPLWKDTSSARDESSLERRWGHPSGTFLGGVGSWIANAVVAMGVVGVTSLTLFGAQIRGPWTIVASAALIVIEDANLFAFGAWLARSGR